MRHLLADYFETYEHAMIKFLFRNSKLDFYVFTLIFSDIFLILKFSINLNCVGDEGFRENIAPTSPNGSNIHEAAGTIFAF